MAELRKMQFTPDDGDPRILPHEEAVKISQKIITTQMVADAFVAGIPIVADGGRYILLDADKHFAT